MVIISQTFLLQYQLKLMDKFPTIENHVVLYTLHLTYSQMKEVFNCGPNVNSNPKCIGYNHMQQLVFSYLEIDLA